MLTKSMKISKDDMTVKDIDFESRTAIVAFASYGSLDRDGDRANKGMFTKSWDLARSDIRFFKNHDKNTAPGRIDEFWEDDGHAYVKVYLGTHTEGEDVLKQLDEKIIVAASYGFIPQKDRMTKIDGKGYDFKQVKWIETSVLTHWGSHPESGIVAVKKSYDLDVIKSISDSIEKMENFIRDTTASDECIIQIEKELQYTKQLLSDIDTAVTSAQEQSTQTQAVSKEGNGFLRELHYFKLKHTAS